MFPSQKALLLLGLLGASVLHASPSQGESPTVSSPGTQFGPEVFGPPAALSQPAEVSTTAPIPAPAPAPTPASASGAGPTPAPDPRQDAGANRLHMMAGFDFTPDFWTEILGALPIAPADFVSSLDAQWDELEARVGFHPKKHLKTLVFMTFGPETEAQGGMGLVIRGSFPLEKLEPEILKLTQSWGWKVDTRAKRPVFRHPNGSSMRFRDPETLVILGDAKETEALFASLVEGPSISPTDLEALRAQNGTSSSAYFLNLVVTPLQKQAMAKNPFLAPIGPKTQALTLRTTPESVDLGVTFFPGQVAQQVAGLLKGGIELVKAQLVGGQQALEKLDSTAFLLDPNRAFQITSGKSLLRILQGLTVHHGDKGPNDPGEKSVVLRFDRSKLPWFGLRHLLWGIALGTKGQGLLGTFRTFRPGAARGPGAVPMNPGMPFPGRSPASGRGFRRPMGPMGPVGPVGP